MSAATNLTAHLVRLESDAFHQDSQQQQLALLLGAIAGLIVPASSVATVEVIEGSGGVTIPIGALWYEYAAEGGTVTVNSGDGVVTRPQGFGTQAVPIAGGLANEVVLANGTGTVHWRYATAA